MAPHPPPCSPDETLWGNLCYPKIDTFRITNEAGTFNFELSKVAPDLLPHLTGASGDNFSMTVKKADDGLDVKIDSVSRESAETLLQKLSPYGMNAKLPD